MIISQHGLPPVRSRTFLDRFDRLAKQTDTSQDIPSRSPPPYALSQSGR